MKEFKQIEVDKVIANPYQPRYYFNEKGIEELAASIEENGLIQPISVRQKGDYYEIVAGERRFRAVQKLNRSHIEAYILDDSEAGSMNKALIENIQREDLSAIEEARAYVKIMQYQHITQSELAKMIGKSQSGIANKIRLLQLNEKVQDAVESKLISERHARAMLSLEEKQQTKMLDAIIKDHLSVEQSEQKIKKMQNTKAGKVATKGYSRNVQVALNTVKQAVAMIEKTGIHAEYHEVDEDEFVTIKIKIKK